MLCFFLFVKANFMCLFVIDISPYQTNEWMNQRTNEQTNQPINKKQTDGQMHEKRTSEGVMKGPSCDAAHIQNWANGDLKIIALPWTEFIIEAILKAYLPSCNSMPLVIVSRTWP